MFISIPGTTVEGDDASGATAHPTLEDALAGLDKLTGCDTLTILDTDKVPLDIAATAVAFFSRAAAVKDYARPSSAQHVELRDVSQQTAVVVRRFA